MSRYIYTLEWIVNCINDSSTVDSGYRHVSEWKSAREAINAARLAYATLYATLGRGGADNTGGGTNPRVFDDIRRKECIKATVEPRNRAFYIAINKRKVS